MAGKFTEILDWVPRPLYASHSEWFVELSAGRDLPLAALKFFIRLSTHPGLMGKMKK